MKHLQALAAAVMLLPAQLLAQLPPDADFRLPSGVEVAGAISTICIGEAQGAILGFAARESGRNLEYVLARFPEPQDAALRRNGTYFGAFRCGGARKWLKAKGVG
jgi:hypothetical protein